VINVSLRNVSRRLGLLTATIILLGTVGFSASSSPRKLNEVDLRVGNVGLGSSLSAVVRKFGKPLSRTQEKVTDEICTSAYSTLTLAYEGITFRLDGDLRGRNFEVVSIEVTSAERLIAPGIRIGMNQKQVRLRLPPPVEERDQDGMHVLLYVTRGNDGSASLDFQDEKLVKVSWTYTLC
jgi:hypothetical protein